MASYKDAMPRVEAAAHVRAAVRYASEAARLVLKAGTHGDHITGRAGALRSTCDLSAGALLKRGMGSLTADGSTSPDAASESFYAAWSLVDASRGIAERIGFQHETALAAALALDRDDVAAAVRALDEARDAAAAARGPLDSLGAQVRLASEADRAVATAEARLSRLVMGDDVLPRGHGNESDFADLVRALVADGTTAVITLALLDDDVVAFLASGMDRRALPLPVDADRAHVLARLLAWSLARSDRRTGARALYQALLAPLAPYVQRRALLIVADGDLADLPFGALDPEHDDALGLADDARDWRRLAALLDEHAELTASSSGAVDHARLAELDTEIYDGTRDLRSSATHRALLDDHVVTLCSSVRTAAHLEEVAGVGAPTLKLLAVADPERDDLPRLPHTRIEVARAAELLGGGTTLEGRDATRARLVATVDALRRDHGEVSVMACHFGAHGLLFSAEDAGPTEVAVLLADGDRLTTPDLARLRIRSFVTSVLCCHSRAGSSTHREAGQLGFALSLHIAGAIHVVACTGAVPDESTAELADIFYAELAGGISPAAALRVAQITVKGRHGDMPGAWAPFLVSGPRPAVRARRRPRSRTSTTSPRSRVRFHPQSSGGSRGSAGGSAR